MSNSAVAVKQYTDLSSEIDLVAEHKGVDRDIVPIAFYIETTDGLPGTITVVPRILMKDQTGSVVLHVRSGQNRELSINKIVEATNVAMVEVQWGKL